MRTEVLWWSSVCLGAFDTFSAGLWPRLSLGHASSGQPPQHKTYNCSLHFFQLASSPKRRSSVHWSDYSQFGRSGKLIKALVVVRGRDVK